MRRNIRSAFAGRRPAGPGTLYVSCLAVKVLLGLALAVAALGPVAGAPRMAHASGPYVVDTLTDGPDSNLADGTCYNTVDGCSLRAAIDQASHDGVPTSITFAAAFSNTTFVLDNAYGTLLWPGSFITVTGGSFHVAISGQNLSPGKSVFEIEGDHNTLVNLKVEKAPQDGVQIGDFAGTGHGNDNLVQNDTIVGNGAAGVYVRGSAGAGGQGNNLVNNLIGTSDKFAAGCVAGEANHYGVYVALGALDTFVNSSVIGCSVVDGVSIDGSGGAPVGTAVVGDDIGTNSAAGGLGNGFAGVAIYSGARQSSISDSVLSGNGSQGIYIAGAATRGVSVTVDYIGLNLDGTLHGNLHEGLLVDGSPMADVQIQGNVISANHYDGIKINSSGYVTITDNIIGTNSFGTGAIQNGGSGVQLNNASFTLIGGTSAADRNLISGNHDDGVLLTGAGTLKNRIGGNYIGTNVTGLAAIGNFEFGVALSGGAHDNFVGGSGSNSYRNVISGNGWGGVSLNESGTVNNLVDGNFIGLNAPGNARLPNGQAGVSATFVSGNSIGSAVPGSQQFIAGNATQGIRIEEAANTVVGASNEIGVGADGITPMGNGQEGILINNSVDSVVTPLLVADNGGAGIAVTGSVGLRNRIVPSRVENNGGLPIDLGDDGPTANDPGDLDTGPNTLLNYPDVTAFAGSTITGTACANCTVWVYRASGNPAAPGGGGTQIDKTVADAGGHWHLTLAGGLTRLAVSFTACEAACGPAANSSEMSPRPALFLPLVWR